MKGLLSQHIVNSIQIIFGGLLIVLMIAKQDFGINFFVKLRNWDYSLYLFGIVFFFCILLKAFLKRKYQIEDPLVKQKLAKTLVYVSYGIFILFFVAKSNFKGLKPALALLAWGLQISALIISFFYNQKKAVSEELIDDQMMQNEE